MAGEWREVRLGQLGEVNRGRSRHRPRDASHLYGGTYPFIQTGDIKASGGRITSHSQTYSEAGLAQSRLWPEGTMVITIAGNIAETAILTYPACFPDSVVGFIADKQRADVRFVEYLFRHLRRQIQQENVGTGSVQDNINLQTLARLTLRIPEPHEQRRIAHFLGTLDDKIENNRKMAKTLEAMAQAIFKSWFVDFDPVRAKMAGESPESICKRLKLTPEILDLFPDRLVDSELGEIPEGWRVDSIYQIADVIYGAPFNSSEFNARQVGEPLIRIRDLTTEVPGVWTTEMHPKGYKVKRGDIVVGMDGEFRAHLWGGAEAWLNQRVCVFAPKKRFSSLFVRNSIVNLLAHVEATETATTVIHIGKNDIDLFIVITPENNLLHAFNRIYQPLYDTLVIAKWETHKLGNIRDTLLPKLISGEIRVPEAKHLIKEAAG
ncbi:MAG: restriction endonuclease subunit S [Acidithiobacillus sp.]